ncbi:mechanosensitive ion channel family protein [Candidatus Gracilibacteria bacterium]|nr:mechanosensitive ion channel family protein [Candidatus Gracilibacteria bacterium]MCF7818999.1 mechanosensitive ion channel family protein [Candidatus Gracilibacteria bacterium]
MEIFGYDISSLLEMSIFGNSVQSYGIAILLFVGFWIGLKIFRSVILRRLEKVSQRTKTEIDDRMVKVLEEMSGFFLWFVAFYLTIKTLRINESIENVLDGLFLVLVVWELIKIVRQIMEFGLQRVSHRKDETIVHGLRLVLNIAIWATAILLVLSNLGFNISALAASLGIGGIAIAFAAQNILGDLFSSFTIYFDKPFQVGDYIVVTGGNGTVNGVVKHIGLKTTRIASLQGEEIVVSNKQLTESNIQNFKKLHQRRVDFQIGVTYDTKTEKLEKIPELIKKAIDPLKGAEFGRAHFYQFADFSLNFKIMYYVDSGDYDDYLNTQQKINLGIRKAFEKEGIEMAFPTQTLYLKK